MLIQPLQFNKENAKEALIHDSISSTPQQEHQPNQYVGK